MDYVRIVTATSLFDGHDASINIMRRIMQDLGAEVIHLAHNRSAYEIVQTAIEEDANAIAVTSYQGGHMEFFKYMHDLLREKNASQIRIFGGGGGVITPNEVKELEDYGITKIFTPQDGLKMGLKGMVQYLIDKSRFKTYEEDNLKCYLENVDNKLHKAISLVEDLINSGKWSKEHSDLIDYYLDKAKSNSVTIGLSGVGGAGKSSLIDEVIRYFKNEFTDKRMAILAIDPTKRGKGALLGDRVRLNSVPDERVYMRSMATRSFIGPVVKSSDQIIKLFKIAGFDLILIETAGIGQADIGTFGKADLNVYVMTPEYGA
ncbi:MAG: cobalamin-dependent protein, partial [Deferribacterota bacterium]|nr:cobalamin-dependent protein [Deferribacterota bacterium]